jgi:hypothetical protein
MSVLCDSNGLKENKIWVQVRNCVLHHFLFALIDITTHRRSSGLLFWGGRENARREGVIVIESRVIGSS